MNRDSSRKINFIRIFLWSCKRRFHLFSLLKRLIGGQGADSCRKSRTGETPQERKRRGGSAAARGKRSLARKSTAVSKALHTKPPLSHLCIFRLN
ncbi:MULTISPECIES: hypothetical protein [Priestia]|uniref:hypothetical protein n=1 Tax=Priestia TaxID=2800373 RepID=UPI001E594E80|nr:MULTISPECIES: hypothetical protein [Priestia]MEB4868998.1 hypothetical protein [Priestia megaterium]